MRGVARVVEMVARRPTRAPELVQALASGDPAIALRAADALEKISRNHRELLMPHQQRLVRVAKRTADPGIRWNLIQILVRLVSGHRAAQSLARQLRVWYLSDPSAIVRTCALDGVVTLAATEPRLTTIAHELLDDANRSPSAAVRARARRLERMVH